MKRVFERSQKQFENAEFQRKLKEAKEQGRDAARTGKLSMWQCPYFGTDEYEAMKVKAWGDGYYEVIDSKNTKQKT